MPTTDDPTARARARARELYRGVLEMGKALGHAAGPEQLEAWAWVYETVAELLRKRAAKLRAKR